MNIGRLPQILITNDDGISAKGIAALIEAAKPFGELFVLAPDKPQSGMGHAITIHDPIRMFKSELYPGVQAYACSGTPVDCVKLGISELLGKKPDLLLSGINHGENSSTNVLYSGTMSAAIEGAMEGIPSFGFSLADFSADADFSAAQHYITILLQHFFEKGEFADLDHRPDTDLHALKEGFVSVVPTHFDLTAYAHLEHLKSWEQ